MKLTSGFNNHKCTSDKAAFEVKITTTKLLVTLVKCFHQHFKPRNILITSIFLRLQSMRFLARQVILLHGKTTLHTANEVTCSGLSKDFLISSIRT